MTRRRWIALGVALALVAATTTLGLVLLFHSAPLKVTLSNHSGATLDGLILISSAGPRTALPALSPGQSVTVSPEVGRSEDALTLQDASGRRYTLLAYYEGNPGGTLTVTITGTAAGSLRGSMVDKTHFAPDRNPVLQALPE